MFVDKLASELVTLLQDLLLVHERLLILAQARQDAMRAYDVTHLAALVEREEVEGRTLAQMELRRRELMVRCQRLLGFAPTTSQVAARCREPIASQLTGLAAKLRDTIERIDRLHRINARVNQAVVKSLAKVLKIVTGVAQHAGLYMRNGRKAALAGIHLLELTA